MKNITVFFYLLAFLLALLAGLILLNNGHISGVSGDVNAIYSSNLRDVPEFIQGNCFGIGCFKTFDTMTPLYLTQYINEYLIMALLDYHIVPFNYNGNFSKAHLININSHKGLINGFNFSDISPGYHDLMFLVFKNPDDYYVNITYLNPATNNTTTFTTWNRDVPVNSLRFNIICMNEEKPSLEYGHIPNNHSSSFDYSSMFVTREPLSSYPWTFQNTLGNEIEPYYINIVNSMRDDVSYVIIQLLDYNQVPLDYNGQDDVYYGKIELNESCSIPATILHQRIGAYTNY